MNQLSLIEKKPSQKQRILDMLKNAGERGLLNTDLNHVAFRFSARIDELRREGHEIETKRVAQGLYRFTLKGKK